MAAKCLFVLVSSTVDTIHVTTVSQFIQLINRRKQAYLAAKFRWTYNCKKIVVTACQ